MKTTLTTTFALVALTLSFALTPVVKADIDTYLGTGGTSGESWGSAFVAVHLVDYTTPTNNEKIDSSKATFAKDVYDANYREGANWSRQFTALTTYLQDMGNTQMSDKGSNATSTHPINYGLLDTTAHDVTNKNLKTKVDQQGNPVNNGGSWEGQEYSVDHNDVHGQIAQRTTSDKKTATGSAKKNNATLGSGLDRLLREEGIADTVLDSKAGHAIAASDSVNHKWTYHAADSVSGTEEYWDTKSGTTTTTIDDHAMGIYAFVKGFTYDAASSVDYLNGWFTTLGNLEDVLINGRSLLSLTSDYFYKSEDYDDSKYFGNYDFELNLANLFDAGYLFAGNNNISFVIDALPAEIILGSHFKVDVNDALIGFAADIWTTDISILPGGPGNPTAPEPATLLIFGLGLAGLGIRRRFATK